MILRTYTGVVASDFGRREFTVEAKTSTRAALEEAISQAQMGDYTGPVSITLGPVDGSEVELTSADYNRIVREEQRLPVAADMAPAGAQGRGDATPAQQPPGS